MGMIQIAQRLYDGVDRRSRARFGPAWEDPALTGALAEVRRGRIEAAVELMAASTDPALRTLRSGVLAEALEPRLEELGAPEDPHVLLLVGAARLDRAWKCRGSAYAKYTSEDQFHGFFAELKNAAEPLYRSAELLPDDPAPWDELQWYCIGNQVGRAELDRTWDELRRRDPANFSGAFGRAQAISEKWHGAPGESAAFADELVGRAKPGSPIVAIAAAAHLEIAWRRMDDSDETSSEFLHRYFSDPGVAGLMRRASEVWRSEIRLHPQDREAHHLLGAVHYFAGDRDRARVHLRCAGKSLPKTLPWSVAALLPGRYYKKVRRELAL